MKYYIVAGEASGDLHGSNLVKELKKQDSAAIVRAWGGDRMSAAGAEVVKHYRELAFMGFAEVVKNLPTIMRNFKVCEEDILRFQPDVVILIDYPGFNLRLAKRLKQHGIKIFYYISPQIWAWKESRIHTIKKVVDRMFVILPFEKDFYAKHGMDVDFVGHPLLDAINGLDSVDPDKFKHENGLDTRPVIALLPGSRKQEISAMLPLMVSRRHEFSNYQLVIAGAPSQDETYYRSILKEAGKDVKVVHGKTYDLLRISEAALVTSGTATLETALLNTPQVVCYKGSAISYQIAKRLVKVKYISLVNLIMDREVVKELIQADFNPKQLSEELKAILPGGSKREKLMQEMELLRQKLGGSGASEVTASLMLKNLQASSRA